MFFFSFSFLIEESWTVPNERPLVVEKQLKQPKSEGKESCKYVFDGYVPGGEVSK